MTKKQLETILDRTQKYIDTHQYYDVLYIFCKIVSTNTKLYDSINLDVIKRPISCNQLLLNLFEVLKNKTDIICAWKGLFCVYIGITLNNLSVYQLVPQNIDSVKNSISRQKLAMSYFNHGMLILNKSEFLLQHDINNSFNHSLCILEFNYLIQLHSDTTFTEEEIKIIYERVKTRLEILIKLNPGETDYRLTMANLITYMEGPDKAKKLYNEVIKTSSTDYSSSLEAMQLRYEFKNTQHKAVIYKM